ncbi:MAG: MBL fold metallo-hydrolase [Thermoanaerobaculia bacterium]
MGPESAALIDTGCGIGNLRRAVEEVTDLPVTVVNTHTHLDHLGGNRQFADIVMFDHPLSRRVADHGAPAEVLRRELLAGNLVTPPWPSGFDAAAAAFRPFRVRQWLAEGDRIDLAGRELEVIHTPGEAPDHICLLDRSRRILFCGDILLHGPVWTHLDGGSLDDLIASYEKLMTFVDDFDHLMPGHNEPGLEKDLLPEALAGARSIAAGRAEFQEVVDPWDRRLRQYSFERISFLTRP